MIKSPDKLLSAKGDFLRSFIHLLLMAVILVAWFVSNNGGHL